MKYHLSNRQLKEIANGKLLRIALPHPPEAVCDLPAWVREHLDTPPDVRILADVDLIPVNPLTHSTGLAACLGTIHHGQPGGWVILVECIVAEISRSSGGLRSRYPTQWPGSVTLDDGRTLPTD